MKKYLMIAAMAAASIILYGCNAGQSESPETAQPQQTESPADEKPAEEAKAGQKEEPEIKEEPESDVPAIKGPLLEKETWYHSVDNSDELPEGSYENYKNYGNVEIDCYSVAGDGYEALDDALFADYEARKQSLQWFEDSIKEGLAYEDEAGFPWPWEDHASLVRCDEKVVSYISDRYTYLGGAHGGTTVTGCNLDSQTGEALTLADVATDLDTLCEYVIEKLEPREEEFFEEWKDNVYKDIHDGEAENGAFAWALGKESIELVFGDYEVAPFAAGHVRVSITDDEYPGIINSKYLDKDALLCKKLTPYEDNYLDLDHDGVDEVLRVETEEHYDEEYKYVDSVTVKPVMVKDGKESYGDEMEDLDFRSAYVMENEDGLYFMYVEMGTYSDWKMLYIYDLNDPSGKIKSIGENETGSFYCFDPIDPENMILMTTIQTMGTRSAYRICHIDVDGRLTPYDEEYRIRFYNGSRLYPEEDYDYEKYKYMNTTAEITGYSDKDRTKEVKIPSGTRLLPLRTDGEKYMIFSMDSGEEVCIYYDEEKPEDEWEHYINGRKESEVFEEVMYAG